MTEPYFRQLNQILRSHKRAIPTLIIDLDRFDQNVKTLRNSLASPTDFRIVVKSLPSIPLIDRLMMMTGTSKLMLFHQPFLSTIAKHYGRKVDLLLGKPMPVRTAAYFYQTLDGTEAFQPPQQLQWLVDTETRLLQYLDLAKRLNQKLRVNLEIDIGLHRGGFANLESLQPALRIIEQNATYLDFSGFMGYDPHIAHLPRALRAPQKSFQLANDFYRSCIELVQSDFPALWRHGLTFNGAGSPTLAFHRQAGSVLNDVSAGSGLVKPTSFDISTLSEYEPACFIATPVLKKFTGTTLPALERFKGLMNLFKPAFRKSYFIYGGYWKAKFCYPPGTAVNPIFGDSSNQSMINTTSRLDLEVDDFVFLRPTQSEFVFLQFGDILVIKEGRVLEEWPVLRQS